MVTLVSGTYPVSSHNEWDPLEEVIVGDLTNATIPRDRAAEICGASQAAIALQPLFAGIRYPRVVLRRAQQELDEFVAMLEREGVRVRRPRPLPFHRRYASPFWFSRGYSCAAPRDVFLIIGEEIIEAPMSWRSRFFESLSYRRLMLEYHRAGARWTSAPKPELSDALYEPEWHMRGESETILTEHEPVFDAADVVRCGRDLFAIRSNTANQSGIDWLRRHLNRNGDAYRVHEIPIRNQHAMHIDHHFIPLAPGRVLVNPEWVVIERLQELVPPLRHWEILEAPQPDGPSHISAACSKWLNMNVLNLDEKRIIVERDQPSMIAALSRWGFEPIPCAFKHYASFGGAFHCATLDVRRRGELRSYCD